MPASCGVQGPGEIDDAVGVHGLDLADRDLVVPADDYVRTQFAQVLHQVIGKGVVVVEDEDHGRCHQGIKTGERWWRHGQKAGSSRLRASE